MQSNEELVTKLHYFKDIINKTILSCQKYKLYDILGANEVNVCINTLNTLFIDIQNELKKQKKIKIQENQKIYKFKKSIKYKMKY